MLSGAKMGTRPLSFHLRSPDFANQFSMLSGAIRGTRPLSFHLRSLSFWCSQERKGIPGHFHFISEVRTLRIRFDALRSEKGYPATFISSQKSRLCESVFDALRNEKGYPATFISSQKSGLCEFVLKLSGAKRGTRPLSFPLRSPDFANSVWCSQERKWVPGHFRFISEKNIEPKLGATSDWSTLFHVFRELIMKNFEFLYCSYDFSIKTKKIKTSTCEGYVSSIINKFHHIDWSFYKI